MLHSLANLPGSSEADHQFYKYYSLLSLVQRGEVIKICKVAKVFKQSDQKLVFAWGCSAEAKILRLWTIEQEIGWQLKQGRSPAGFMERELSSWATELMS